MAPKTVPFKRIDDIIRVVPFQPYNSIKNSESGENINPPIPDPHIAMPNTIIKLEFVFFN